MPAVAAAKIEGLKRFYGIDDEEALSFFTVHLHLDEVHSEVTGRLLERHARSSSEATRAIEAGRAASTALWSFLDGVTTN